MEMMKLDCRECHTCESPTLATPCLKACPRLTVAQSAGKIPACVSCHSIEANEQNLRQPSLKGAYHRQCMNCHREWSHENRRYNLKPTCAGCHDDTRDSKAVPPGKYVTVVRKR